MMSAYPRHSTAWLAAAAAAAIGLAGPADAQLSGLTGGDEPIEIEAIDSLEWYSEEKMYVARGDVVLRQGDTTLTADTVTAAYRELEDGSTEIFKLTAEGNVVITSPDQTVTGATGVYDVDKAVFVMAGGDLKLGHADRDGDRARHAGILGNPAARRGPRRCGRGAGRRPDPGDELTPQSADGPDGRTGDAAHGRARRRS